MSVAFPLSASSRACRHHGSSPESQKACYKRISQSITDHRSQREKERKRTRAKVGQSETKRDKERQRETKRTKRKILSYTLPATVAEMPARTFRLCSVFGARSAVGGDFWGHRSPECSGNASLHGCWQSGCKERKEGEEKRQGKTERQRATERE